MAAQLRVVVLAVSPCKQHGIPRAAAHQGKQEQIHHGACNADGRKLLLAGKAPHHKGIHRVIKFLQDIAHHQGCRQAEQMPRQAALR